MIRGGEGGGGGEGEGGGVHVRQIDLKNKFLHGANAKKSFPINSKNFSKADLMNGLYLIKSLKEGAVREQIHGLFGQAKKTFFTPCTFFLNFLH